MKTLSSIDFTLVIGCSLNCSFCPQKKLTSTYFKDDKNRRREMTLEDFKVILDKVDPGATIDFAGMAEPFLNKSCADMIVYAYNKGFSVSVYTTLMGMTFEDFEKIKDIKFDRFVVHIPEVEQVCHFVLDENYYEILKLVHQYINIDFYSCHGTVHPSIEDIIDKAKVPNFNPQNRAGNLLGEELTTYDWKGRIECYRVWSSKEFNLSWMPEVLPDGTMLLCCQDYGIEHVLGNIITQEYEEILKGEGVARYLRGLACDTENTICRKCKCARPYNELPSIILAEKVKDIREKTEISLTPQSLDFAKRFASADKLCVYGLGKLFKEHFFQEHWDEGLGVDYLSDQNQDLYGKRIGGVEIKALEDENDKDILIVLFVKNYVREITKRLNNLGFYNIITIDEVIDKCNMLSRETVGY